MQCRLLFYRYQLIERYFEGKLQYGCTLCPRKTKQNVSCQTMLILKKIWCIVSWLNLLRRNVNVFHLVWIVSQHYFIKLESGILWHGVYCSSRRYFCQWTASAGVKRRCQSSSSSSSAAAAAASHCVQYITHDGDSWSVNCVSLQCSKNVRRSADRRLDITVSSRPHQRFVTGRPTCRSHR